LSQNWHIIFEGLAGFEERIKFLLKAYSRYMDSINSYQNQGGDWSLNEEVLVDDSIKYLASRCDIYKRWAINYKDRTNIRINLVSGIYHLT
jgi:hypothetical protein